MNPYDVLGLPGGAGEDEVKARYRELARKYSAQQYAGNPLEDIARDKMEEIDRAYDEIMHNLISAGGAGKHDAHRRTARGPGARSSNTQFGDIRAKINTGRLDDAEMLLDGVPQERRDAEWYYLKGSIQHRRGWFEEASRHYGRANEMEPDNEEYSEAYRRCENNRQGKFYDREPGTCRSCGTCPMCTTLMLANCCCSACRCLR